MADEKQESDRSERQDQDHELKKLRGDQDALKQRLADLKDRLDALKPKDEKKK